MRKIWERNCFGLDPEQQEDCSKMQPRRIPLARQEAADKAVLEMQQTGFIEPSDSPWAAPVIMVPKKGGKLRFCAYYRTMR